MIFLIIVSLIVLLILVVYFLILWPNQCFLLAKDNDQLMFDIGIDVSQQRVLFILSKPVEIGNYQSPMDICDEPRPNVDIAFLTAFDSLMISPVFANTSSEGCTTTTNSHQNFTGENLKFAIGDGEKFAKIQSIGDTKLSFKIEQEMDRQKNQSGKVKIAIEENSIFNFNPAIGVSISDMFEFYSSQLAFLEKQSENNQCHDDSISISYQPTSFFGQLIGIFKILIIGEKLLSNLGLTHFVAIKNLQIDQIEARTNQLVVDFHHLFTDRISPNFKPTMAKISIDHLNVQVNQLNMTKVDGEQVSFQCKVKVEAKFSDLHVIGQVLKDETSAENQKFPLEVVFEEASIDFVVDTNILLTSNADILNSFNNSIPQQTSPLQTGHFSLKGFTSTGPFGEKNSSFIASRITGQVEPVTVKSTDLDSFNVAVSFTLNDLTGKNVKIQNSEDKSPMFELYKVEKVANSIHFQISPEYFGLKPPVVVDEKDIEQVLAYSEALRNRDDSMEEQEEMEEEVPEVGIEPMEMMFLQQWQLKLAGVKAAAFLPTRNIFKLDSLSFTMDPSAKANSTTTKTMHDGSTVVPLL